MPRRAARRPAAAHRHRGIRRPDPPTAHRRAPTPTTSTARSMASSVAAQAWACTSRSSTSTRSTGRAGHRRHEIQSGFPPRPQSGRQDGGVPRRHPPDRGAFLHNGAQYESWHAQPALRRLLPPSRPPRRCRSSMARCTARSERSVAGEWGYLWSERTERTTERPTPNAAPARPTSRNLSGSGALATPDGSQAEMRRQLGERGVDISKGYAHALAPLARPHRPTARRHRPEHRRRLRGSPPTPAPPHPLPGGDKPAPTSAIKAHGARSGMDRRLLPAATNFKTRFDNCIALCYTGIGQEQPLAERYHEQPERTTKRNRDESCQVTYRHPRTGPIIKINSRQMMENKAMTHGSMWSASEAHETPGYWEMPENKETELDRQWRIDGGR